MSESPNMNIKYFRLSALLLLSISALMSSAQSSHSDSLFIRRIYDEALTRGESYSNLRYLCKAIGHRLSGSPQAEEAVLWGENLLKKYDFDRVELQPITVPFWERGEVEKAAIDEGIKIDLQVTALGGSVGTGGVLRAKVIEVHSLDALDTMDRSTIEGKIVFFNRPMEPRNISTFQSYGGCVDQRYSGAAKAAQYGAVGVLVRSMTLLDNDEHPHTGSMGYKDSIPKIPAAALSTKSANFLHGYLEDGASVDVVMELNCRTNPDKASFNVIGELKGSLYPDEIIVVGGHLDSWDIGEGAHDDGAGIVHSIEALRLLKELGYQPLHTLRVVLFMNEENGNMGGINYAKAAREKGENHIVALESDRGGFVPRGFTIQGTPDQVQLVRSFSSILKPYDLHYFEPGFGGVDIMPLGDEEKKVNPDLFMMGLIPDSQRYFDHHHAETDVFENVHKRELELGCAAMASMIYLLDQNLVRGN